MDYPAPGARAILNANKGISNTIEQKVINTDLKRVTENLFKTLSHHYGPYSGFAAIDDGQPLDETNFTKDGIGIVRAIEYASPQEEWVRKTIAYIGTKMETSVGDGTTSAMMFTCAMLRHMSEHLDELRPLSYNRFRNGFADFINYVKEEIDSKYAFKPYDKTDDTKLDPNKVYNIVYNQVYTSSHGDRRLSRALAEMYKELPKELWERMTYERCLYETDKDFEVVKSEGQYQMNAQVFTSSMLNKDLCTWYESNNATVIVMNDTMRYNSPDWPAIMQRLDEGSPSRPVVIICHTQMDRESYQHLNEKIVECDKAGRPFAIFTSKPDNPKVNDYTALQTIIGVDVTKYANGEALFVEGCHVKYKSKKLSIDGLVEVPEEYFGKNERHQVTDGKHSQFTDTLEAWKNQADWYTKQATTKQDRDLANYFLKMYVKLRYNHTYTVVIGGKTYDNVAFVDVLDDAIRAASRALTNGATFGNNRTLYLVVSDILKIEEKKNNPFKLYRLTPEILWFAKRVKESLEDIANVVLKRIHPDKFFFPGKKKDFVQWWFSHAVDLLLYDTVPEDRYYRSMPWRDEKNKSLSVTGFRSIDSLFEHCDKSELGYICQPANSDIIMLERFGEIALKFILTEHVIIRGGAYVKEKKGK